MTRGVPASAPTFPQEAEAGLASWLVLAFPVNIQKFPYQEPACLLRMCFHSWNLGLLSAVSVSTDIGKICLPLVNLEHVSG